MISMYVHTWNLLIIKCSLYPCTLKFIGYPLIPFSTWLRRKMVFPVPNHSFPNELMVTLPRYFRFLIDKPLIKKLEISVFNKPSGSGVLVGTIWKWRQSDVPPWSQVGTYTVHTALHLIIWTTKSYLLIFSHWFDIHWVQKLIHLFISKCFVHEWCNFWNNFLQVFFHTFVSCEIKIFIFL